MADYPKPVANEDQVRDSNQQGARRMLAAYSWAQTEMVKEYISPDIINRSAHPAGTEDEQEEMRTEHDIFPDIHFREELVITEGDMVFLGWVSSASHTGELYGKKPTGIKIELHGGEILRFEDGMIVEHWDHYTKPRLEAYVLLGVMDEDSLKKMKAEGLS
ncbi:ester cyclase [Nocardia sp. NPDC060256]|uniref:ester cyclase n=1 Tax=unclassified Nocardia TaxID=2637762 RepID=UPI003659EAFC